MNQHLSVGDSVSIEGIMASSKYVDSNGVKRVVWNVIVERFEESEQKNHSTFRHLSPHPLTRTCALI